ncbi:MAG: hypothetical protein AAF394_18615 [Planctomycetota bacterium]
MLKRFQRLIPVNQQGADFERSACVIAGKPMVVFHKQGKSLAPASSHNWPEILSYLDCGPVLELEESSWAWSSAPSSDFNCHAMAIGSRLGLTPRDWLEGVASAATLDENPTRILLEHFFEPLAPTQNSHATLCLLSDDVFVCYNTAKDQFIHSGFIKLVNQETVAISKFGEGPILLTSLALIKHFYHGKFDQLLWYRFNEHSTVSERSYQGPERLHSGSPRMIHHGHSVLGRRSKTGRVQPSKSLPKSHFPRSSTKGGSRS